MLVEFIVSFKSLYQSSARSKFIKASLNQYNSTSWSLIERHNPATNFPSDFELIRISSDDEVKDLIESLRRHPAIKDITQQRLITRTLKFINDTSIDNDFVEDIDDESEENSRWYSSRGRTNVRQQLSWLNAFSFGGGQVTDTRRKLLRAVPRQITSVLHADVLWVINLDLRNSG